MKEKVLNLKRRRLLIKIEKIFEGPMIFLGFVWLILLIIEFLHGFDRTLEVISTVIWILFVIDFILKFFLAPGKLIFLKKNILTAVSLIIPALRLFRIFRVIRLLRIFRGTHLIKVIASINRSMKSLNATMTRRGFGYVISLTIFVALAGAAGMYTFEKHEGGFTSFAHALWWTIMLVITVGTNYWPETAEGRILCTLLSLYGFAVFGYITATLASFFIGRDAELKDGSIAGAKEINELKAEIIRLNSLIADRYTKEKDVEKN